MHIRAYDGSDESQLLDVWQSAMHVDRISPAIFHTQVLLDPNFTPENLPVAVVDGRVVGFVLALTRQVPLFLQGLEPENAWITAFGVHADYQRQRIGEALFQHISARLTADGRKTIDIASYVPNYFVPGVDINNYPGTIPFLEQAAGFKKLYEAISMGADLTDFTVPPEIDGLMQRRAADGLTIAPVTAADIPDLMSFIVEHFGWDWYRHAQSYLLEIFGGDPGRICFLVARMNGQVVGFCQQRNERFGPFGVHPDYRNKGIGRLLLFRCLEIMSAQHVFFAYFLWTGEDAARLYGTAGFKRRRTFAVMRKTL